MIMISPMCRLQRVQKQGYCPALNRLAFALLLGFASLSSTKSLYASVYYWDPDGNGVGIGGSGNWDVSTALWRSGSTGGVLQVWPNTTRDSDAFLTGSGGTLTLTSGISVNDLTVSANYGIQSSTTQVLTLNGSSTPVVDVGSGSTLTVSAGLAGTLGITKSGAGTLLLSSTSNTLTGGISVEGGSLQVLGSAASTALRNNVVSLASGRTLSRSDSGATVDFRMGALSGAGNLTLGTNSGTLLPVLDQTFSGTITATGFAVRGAATQTLSGTLSGITSVLAVGGRGGLTLAGSAAATGVTSVALSDRGNLTLSNSATDSTNRLSSVPISSDGGFLTYSGNSGGSTETLGSATFNSGQTVVSVQHAAGSSAATVLTLDGIVRGTSGAAVNFSSTGGLLVASGFGPRIAITNTPTLKNGVIAASSTTTNPGYAIVNGGDFATYSGSGNSGGIVAVTSDPVSDPANLTSSPNSNVVLTGNGTALVPVTFNTLKIAPSLAGQSLSLSSTLSTYGVILSGSGGNDFTISGGSIGGSSSRYFHIWDPNRTLTVSSSFAGANQPLIKAGDGFMVLSGSTDQVNIGSLGNIYLLGGTLRASPQIQGNPVYNFGSSNNILYLKGGVLEIANGATFTRPLGGNTGGVSFDESGGFSAFGSDAIVNLGGSSATATWNTTNGFVQDGDALLFGSSKSNAKLTFQNPINLAGTGYQAREFRVFDNPNSTADLATVSGAISGPLLTDLLKTGEGTLELAGANTFTGNVIVQQGTLATSGGSALPDGGTIVMADIVGATLQLKANETIGALSGGGASGGNVSLQANTLTVGDQRDSTFGGVLSGAGGKLIKQGTGLLTLSRPSTFTGGTTIVAGAIRLGSDNALPTTANPGAGYGVALAGGTLMLNGNNLGTVSSPGGVTASAGALTLTQNSTINFNPNDTTQLAVFSAFAPGSNTLTITGWTGSLFLGSTTSGLLFSNAGWDPSKLGNIVFTDLNGTPIPAGSEVFNGDPNYTVVEPVPEVSPKWAGFALLGFIAVRQLRAAGRKG